uniref:Uncharacterized protein n=3 Tax=Oryza TaxID=4527 RepID=A0A0D3ELI4_9ORYZ
MAWRCDASPRPGCETEMRRLALPLPTPVRRRGRRRVLFVAWLARVQGIQLHWPVRPAGYLPVPSPSPIFGCGNRHKKGSSAEVGVTERTPGDEPF